MHAREKKHKRIMRVRKGKFFIFTYYFIKLKVPNLFICHVMRNNRKYAFLPLIMLGKIEGKRGPGRTRNFWLKHL